jgi:capsular polysaccharide biosynthesis protein
MREEISLKELYSIIRKRMGVIVITTILSVLASGVLSFYVLTPVYEASTQILVNQSKDKEALYNFNEVQTNIQLINTYSVIIKSPAILEKVNEDLDLNMSTAALNEKVSVASEQNSQVVNIVVQSESQRKAVEIANKTAEIFQKEIIKIMNIDNVTILAKSTISADSGPVKPQPILNIIIAFIIGLMVGLGIVFLIEYLDYTIKTEEDIEKELALPTLGVIAHIGKKEVVKLRAKQKQYQRGEMLDAD